MMNVTWLKIVTIIEVFIVSELGYNLPLLFALSHGKSLSFKAPWFKILKAFSGGVVVSVAMLHLLPDAMNKLHDDNTAYPGI